MENNLTKKQKFSSREKSQFAASFSTFAINGAVALSVGALLPYVRDTYGLGYAFAGMLVSLHSVGNLISCFTTGLATINFGRKKSMMAFSCLVIIAYFLLATAKSPFALAAAFLLTGLGRGSISNFNNTVISEIAPGKAWALNTLHASFAIGAFLSPLAVLMFTSGSETGWVYMCWLLAGLGVAEVVIYFFMPMDNSSDKKGNSAKNMGFMKKSSFWLGTGTLFFYLCAEQGVIGWLVTYFKDTGLLTAQYAQTMASVLWILILAGRLSAAALSQKIKRSTLLAIMSIGFFAFFVVLLLGKTLPVITIGIAGFGFSMAGIYPTTVALSGKTIKDYPLSWSFMLTAASFGSILMPSIIGAVADVAGIYAGISSIVIAIILAVCFIWANVIRCRKEEK